MSARPPANVEQDLSVSMVRATVDSLAISVPLAVVMVGLYVLVWGPTRMVIGLAASPRELLVWLILLPVGIVAHEALHAVAWLVLGRKPASAVKFGFAWKALAPYAHLKVPIGVRAYRAGGILPALVLGALPYLAGLATGHAWLTVYGTLFAIAASGDLLVLWLIRRVPAGKQVQDHPTRAGCYVLSGRP